MIEKHDLIEWLGALDGKLKKNIVLIAVGGTAMTLLGFKPSTIDIDFCLDLEDKKEFEKVLDKKFKVDIFVDGYIFSEQLPVDYREKSKEILAMNHITLKALHPVDIIITKSARLNARDEEDIQALVRHVEKNELLRRFEVVVKTYAGNEKNYRANFDYILRRFFGGT